MNFDFEISRVDCIRQGFPDPNLLQISNIQYVNQSCVIPLLDGVFSSKNSPKIQIYHEIHLDLWNGIGGRKPFL